MFVDSDNKFYVPATLRHKILGQHRAKDSVLYAVYEEVFFVYERFLGRIRIIRFSDPVLQPVPSVTHIPRKN